MFGRPLRVVRDGLLAGSILAPMLIGLSVAAPRLAEPAGAAPSLSAPTIGSTAGDLIVGKDRRLVIHTTGRPKPTLTEVGALPSGITFATSTTGMGILSGTPNPGTGGSYPLTITASNSQGTTTQVFTLTVIQNPVYPTGFCPTTMTVGSYFWKAQSVLDYPFFFGLTLTSTLPTGLTFQTTADTTLTGFLSGTPVSTDAGKTVILYSATNNETTVTKNEHCKVEIDGAPIFTGPAFSTAVVGSHLTAPVLVGGTGGFPRKPTVTETGTLPAGITGTSHSAKKFGVRINGKPATGTAGDYRLTVSASNGVGGTVTEGYVMVVRAPGTTPKIPSLAVNSASWTPTTSTKLTTTYGHGISVTATVSGTGATPTGYVEFRLSGANAPTTVALATGRAQYTVPATLPGGSYQLAVSYTGSPSYATAATTVTLTVNAATTTTTLTRTSGEAAAGKPATFTATVGSAEGTPQGDVTFQVDGQSREVPLDGSGHATFSTASATLSAAATNRLTATYLPFSNAPRDWAGSVAPTPATIVFGPTELSSAVSESPTSVVAAITHGPAVTVGSVVATEAVRISATLSSALAAAAVPPGPLTIAVTSLTGATIYTATVGIGTPSLTRPVMDSFTAVQDYFWTIPAATLTTLVTATSLTPVTSVLITLSSPGSTLDQPSAFAFVLAW